MESFEEFSSRTLRALLLSACSTAPVPQRSLSACSTAPVPQRSLSALHFSGRSLIPPALSEELRALMAEERQRAIERDRERQTRKTNALLERVQDILNNIHVQKVQSEEDSAELAHYIRTGPAVSHCMRPYSAPPQNQNQTLSPRSSLKRETLRLLNQRMEGEREGQDGCEEKTTSSENCTCRKSETDEEDENTRTDLPLQLESDESSNGTDPGSPDSVLGGLDLSLLGSYPQLPRPQGSRSPLAPRAQRPRPHTTGNIFISCPVSESELSPDKSETETHLTRSANNKQHSSVRSLLPPSGGEWNCSCSELSDGKLSLTPFTHSNTTVTSLTSPTQLDPTPDVKPTRRSPPAPLNQSYDVESPSPCLNRPEVTSTPSAGSAGPVRRRLELDTDSQHPLEDRRKQIRASKTQQGTERQIEALEMMYERLEREHTLLTSDLLTAPERDTHLDLQQELHRKVRVQRALEPSWTQTHQLKKVLMENTQAFHRLSAAVRGFLTRRLLKTEKITHLRKTVQDSREFIRSFQTDSQLKRTSISHQDLTLQHRVTAQLRAALNEVHQIFFVWPVRKKLRLLQRDRELHRERELREKRADGPTDSRNLSSATLKTLERRAQRQVKKQPRSPPLRILRSSLSQNRACPSQQIRPPNAAAVKKREESLRVRQRSVQRKHLSLG